MIWSRTLALMSSPLWGSNLPPVLQESSRWLRTSSCLPPILTFRGQRPCPLPPADGVGGATVQWWTEGDVLQSSLLRWPSSATILPSRNFSKYIAHVQRIVAMFGGTYCCEQLFSKMKCTKSPLRSLLSDRHINGIPLLSSSTIEPDIDKLLHGKQHQPYHCFACLATKLL